MPSGCSRRLRVCTLVVVAGFLAGCGGSGGGSASTTTSSATSATGVVLGADGLGIVQTGDPQTSAVQAVSCYLGAPTKTTTAGPCNRTTEVEWSDLSLEFSHGVLDGYRYLEGGLSDAGTFHPPTGPGTPVLKTASGATLGMTLVEVRPQYPASAFSEVQGSHRRSRNQDGRQAVPRVLQHHSHDAP